MRPTTVLLSLCCLALVASGCGEDETSQMSGSQTVTGGVGGSTGGTGGTTGGASGVTAGTGGVTAGTCMAFAGKRTAITPGITRRLSELRS